MPPSSEPASPAVRESPARDLDGASRCLTFQEVLASALGPAGPGLLPLELDQHDLLRALNVRLQIRCLDGLRVEVPPPRAARPSWFGRLRELATRWLLRGSRLLARHQTDEESAGPTRPPAPGDPEMIIQAGRSGGSPVTWSARSRRR